MKIFRLLALAACATLFLSACNSRPQLTMEQVKGVVGLSMQEVNTRLGMASAVTNAGGDSVWWEYIGLTRPNGTHDGSCHVIFRKGVVEEVRC